MPKQSAQQPKNASGDLIKAVNDIRKKAGALRRDVSSVITRSKNSYTALDSKTKKKVAMGVAGIGAILAATALIVTHTKKKK